METENIIDIVLPVHNEGASIAATLREFYQTAAKDGVKVRFVVCEDGSTDDTVPVLTALRNELPILLITGKERKGYSRAVIDGFRATTAPLIGFIDSDGQCDPADFKAFVKKMPEGFDFVLGYRNPRCDHWIRLVMSGAFKCAYRMLFPVTFRDPSCPYLLVKREYLQKALIGKVGTLKQGFWWEFVARMRVTGAKMTEIPVRHRIRAAGETQVYKPLKVPGIAWAHLLGLLALRRELKQLEASR
jgi:glycosyltransferase involved in cell wall biosynthesis